MEKSAKRKKAEAAILELMTTLDGSGYNTKRYKAFFNTLNTKDFEKWLKSIADNDTPEKLYFEMNCNDKTRKNGFPNMDHIVNTAKKFNVDLTEYVSFPHRSDENDFLSSTEVPILRIPLRKLVQMGEKKNMSVSNIDVVNSMTGQVTGDSKASMLNDTQVFSLTTTNQTNSIKELLGPRADDSVAKNKMLSTIEQGGKCSLKELNLNIRNKQAINTMHVFWRGAGFDTTWKQNKKKVSTEDYSLEHKLSKSERDALPDDAFGISDERKYPLYTKKGNPDKTHIRSAMTLFEKCDPKKKYELANKILYAARKADIRIKKEAEWYTYTTEFQKENKN